MNIIFRVDASLQIGTGHVMRCLTLADELANQGATCHFICREHKGHLLEMIRERGHMATGLPRHSAKAACNPEGKIEDSPPHYSWLGTDWHTDLEQARSAIDSENIDWLIVDHYALDARWEGAMREACTNVMVIDDLADRKHDCDLLLDQNFGRVSADYDGQVPSHCKVLTGPKYALLRPEFAELRDYSLSRRAEPQLKHLLITMGGVDQLDATSQVLEAIKSCSIPDDCKITVVMGAAAPWLARVRTIAAEMPWPTEVKVNTNEMARIMADSDLVIGAVGSTAWERACLGLPTIMVVLATNQESTASHMAKEGLGQVIGLGEDLLPDLVLALTEFSHFPHQMTLMSQKVRGLSQGDGCQRLLAVLSKN